MRLEEYLNPQMPEMGLQKTIDDYIIKYHSEDLLKNPAIKYEIESLKNKLFAEYSTLLKRDEKQLISNAGQVVSDSTKIGIDKLNERRTAKGLGKLKTFGPLGMLMSSPMYASEFIYDLKNTKNFGVSLVDSLGDYMEDNVPIIGGLINNRLANKIIQYRINKRAQNEIKKIMKYDLKKSVPKNREDNLVDPLTAFA